ncbi:MAG: R3H domain-containing nucleic acid-binding protein [Patescibacteria group bacterium]
MQNKNVAKDKLKKIEEITISLLSLMGSKAKVGISFDETNQTVLINLETDEETGLLIGRQGETLTAIQTILGMIVRKNFDEWVRISVNVGDYQEKQESRLRELATQTALRAKETKEPQYLYNLTPNQRRIVHLTLSEDTEIETESQGEGAERFLVVRMKK